MDVSVPHPPRTHKRLVYLNAIAAVTTVAVEYVVYLALVYFFDVGIEVSNVIGAVLGIIVNFAMSRLLVFPDATGGWGMQALRYCLVTAVGIAGSTALLHVQVHSLGIPHWIAWGSANLIQFTVWTYPTNRFIVFPEPRAKASAAPHAKTPLAQEPPKPE